MNVVRDNDEPDINLLFFLALTLGPEDEPLPALERMAGVVEATGRRHGVEEPLQMTLGLSDGERLYAVRYASGLRSSAEAWHVDDLWLVGHRALRDVPRVSAVWTFFAEEFTAPALRGHGKE